MIESYTSTEAINRAAENAGRFFSVADERERSLRAAVAQVRSASANRLVKAAKSPTDRFPGSTGAYFNRPAPRRKPAAVELDGYATHYAPNLKQAGTWAVVERRDWSKEHRIRMETRPGAKADLPSNEGDRVTEMLTQRAGRKISESCYFMACRRGGFSTFATLTLNAEARAKLAQKVIVPKYPVSKNSFSHFPVEPARAKQGPLGVLYQTDGETPAYNISEKHVAHGEMRHPESGSLFTPMKEAWAWSVQKEASRFFEAANKMYTRGWQYRRANAAGLPCTHMESSAEFSPITGEWRTVKVAGSRKCVAAKRTATTDGAPVTWLADGPYTPIRFKAKPLAYLWVAENPDRIDDDSGEFLGENPHIHLLMQWRVDFQHFKFWARRLERLWGHGVNHLEKIKDPEKAGGYVAKAAGYLTKAQHGDENYQGKIRGNRYGISARARAPGWIESERHQVGMMGWLLAEAHDLWKNKHGEKIQRRERLKWDLEKATDKTHRQKIGRLLEQVRGEIEPLPRASKYGILFKSEAQKTQFFDWAKRKGWTAEPQNSLWLENWRRQQWRRRNRGRLEASAGDLAAWFEMADSGAVA